MKKYKFLVLVIILQLFNRALKAQNFITLQNPENVKFYLLGKYDLKNVVCENSFTFLKFKINGKGDLQDLDFSKNTPEALKNEVKQKILKSDGFWIIKENEKSILTKTVFILPIVFMLKFNCPEAEVLISTNPNTDIQNKLYKSFTDAFGNALNFNSSSLNSINCILISPIIITP